MSEAPHPPTESGWPAIGAVLGGRYELLRRLGAGGMADVYAARFLASRRKVAVKRVTPTNVRLQDFELSPRDYTQR